MIIRFMRPDRISYALKIFVEKTLGKKYIENNPFDIEKTL